jgi:hypothetical protein
MSVANISKHKNKNSYGLKEFLLYGAVVNVPDSERQSVVKVLFKHFFLSFNKNTKRKTTFFYS